MSQSNMGLESKPVLTKLGLGALFLTYFLSAFMVNGLSIASPKIAADLNGMDLFSWAISLPALAAAFVTLLYGRLSDLYGRRIMILISLAFFLAGVILFVRSSPSRTGLICRATMKNTTCERLR